MLAVTVHHVLNRAGGTEQPLLIENFMVFRFFLRPVSVPGLTGSWRRLGPVRLRAGGKSPGKRSEQLLVRS